MKRVEYGNSIELLNWVYSEVTECVFAFRQNGLTLLPLLLLHRQVQLFTGMTTNTIPLLRKGIGT